MTFVLDKDLLERARRDKAARIRLVLSSLDKTIACQLRAMRKSRNWTQVQLGEAIGTTGSYISRIECEDYGMQNLNSLKRIAKVFDVALVVQFIPFSEYIDGVSGAPHLNATISSAGRVRLTVVSKRELLERARSGKRARTKMVSSHLNKAIASLIRAARRSRDWTQTAEVTGRMQTDISKLQSSGYGDRSLTSLKRIAAAVDVAFVVRFVRFDEFIDWLSGARLPDARIASEPPAPIGFDEEDLTLRDAVRAT